MVKILLADTDTKRNSASYQFLSNEKDFEIESTNFTKSKYYIILFPYFPIKSKKMYLNFILST